MDRFLLLITPRINSIEQIRSGLFANNNPLMCDSLGLRIGEIPIYFKRTVKHPQYINAVRRFREVGDPIMPIKQYSDFAFRFVAVLVPDSGKRLSTCDFSYIPAMTFCAACGLSSAM